MSTKEAYKQRIVAELDVVQAKFAKFKAQRVALAADAREKHAKHVDELEKKFAVAQARLKDLGEAEEHVWESLKDGVEHTWGALQSALQDAIENFKTEPPIADPHGLDEGAYPYGEGLKGHSTEKL